MRYSHQRELILREVRSRTDHPTAEMICTALREESPRLSLGTVYRDLNTLVERGEISRVPVPGAADRFDGETTPHQHLYCRRCHKVESLYIPTSKLQAYLDACPGIRAESYNLIAFGLCTACAEESV